MSRLVRRAAAPVALVAAALGACLAFTGTANAATTAGKTMEDQISVLVNQKRAAAKCGPLRVDEKLRAAARAQSRDMAAHNFFSHNGSDGSSFVTRAGRAGYTQAMAENIAWGYRTPTAVLNGWMNSPPHRANLMNCSARSVGVGVAFKSDGTPYWTQDFGRS